MDTGELQVEFYFSGNTSSTGLLIRVRTLFKLWKPQKNLTLY
jgi:hypothetical protein